jgi:hypothetical protein
MPPPPLAGNDKFYAKQNAAITYLHLSGHIYMHGWNTTVMAVIADGCINMHYIECVYGVTGRNSIKKGEFP